MQDAAMYNPSERRENVILRAKIPWWGLALQTYKYTAMGISDEWGCKTTDWKLYKWEIIGTAPPKSGGTASIVDTLEYVNPSAV